MRIIDLFKQEIAVGSEKSVTFFLRKWRRKNLGEFAIKGVPEKTILDDGQVRLTINYYSKDDDI